MTVNGWAQIGFYCVVLLAVTKPAGMYLARVYDGTYQWLAPVERAIYRLCGVDPDDDQHWTHYAASLLIFSAATMLVTLANAEYRVVAPLEVSSGADAVTGE